MSSDPPPGWKRPGGVPHPGDVPPGGQYPPPGPPPPPGPRAPTGPPGPPAGFPPPGPSGPGGPGGPYGPGGPGGPGGPYQPAGPPPATPPPGKSKLPLIIAIVVAVAVVGGAAFFVLNRGGGENVADPTDSPSAQTTAPPTRVPLEDQTGAPGASDAPTEASTGLDTPSEATEPADGGDDNTGRVIDTVDDVLADEVGDYTLGRRVNAGLDDTGAIDSAELRYNVDPPDPDRRIDHIIGVYESQSAATDRIRNQSENLTPPFEVAEERELADPQGDVYGLLVALNDEDGDLALVLWSNRNAYFSLTGGNDADLTDFYNTLPY